MRASVRLRLAETSPADKATITVQDFGVKFLREHAVEPNSKMTYAQLLRSHVYPFIGTRRVAEIGRETIHRLLNCSAALRQGASQSTVVNVRTCLSAMMQMAWDHGYRDGNPVEGSGWSVRRPGRSWWRPSRSFSGSTRRCRASRPGSSPGSGIDRGAVLRADLVPR